MEFVEFEISKTFYISVIAHKISKARSIMLKIIKERKREDDVLRNVSVHKTKG